MEEFNITDCKMNLTKSIGELLEQYFLMEKKILHERQYNSESLNTMNSNNMSLCKDVKLHEDTNFSLEKEIDGYKHREQQLNETITNLKSIKETDKEMDQEINKFDIVRGQAKEITAKDNEIMRLTKELKKLKELNDIKININMEVNETKDTIGWSPTNKTSSPHVETMNLNKGNDKSNNDNEESEGEEEELYIIKYGRPKETYYRDSENNVFTILDNEDKGDKIGTWTKQSNGKYKLIRD